MFADGQVRQASDCALLHSKHDEWHELHVPCPPRTSTKEPVAGHVATHVPLERKGVSTLVHDTQSLLVGPLHVPQVESQGSQTLELFAYFATGVHEARQLPVKEPATGSKNGVAVAHV